MSQVDIRTRDGVCPSHVFWPDVSNRCPPVIMYMDGIGIRPAMVALAEQLSHHGYFVVLPDLYYRSGPYAPMNAKTTFADPVKRKALIDTFMSKLTNALVMSDTRAVLDFLKAHPKVKLDRGVGTTGYCMGGALSLTAAGTYPDEVSASASYHGSRLASDAPDSPHLLAPKMKASVFVAGASDDPSFPDEMKARLEQALTDARVNHVVVSDPAKHGWVLSDTATSDAAGIARHWASLVRLLDQKLGGNITLLDEMKS